MSLKTDSWFYSDYLYPIYQLAPYLPLVTLKNRFEALTSSKSVLGTKMALDDNQKIGIGLITLGIAFIMLGMMMFFDRSFIAMGNALFLTGLLLCLGMKRTITLFLRREKLRGSICFFLGFFCVIIMRWGLIGMLLQGFGAISLFIPDRSLFPSLLAMARQLPVVGKVLDLPGVSHVADLIAGKASRPKYSV